LSDNLNNVTNSRIEGKADKSKGFWTYILARRIISEKVMLNDSSRSSNNVGRGITIKTKMPITATAMKTSLFLAINGS
jgi:hypothetical protein